MGIQPRPRLKTKVPDPVHKLGTLHRTIGKTIVGVEFGAEQTHPDCHQAEAIILHFSDGQSLSITVGSNVGNLKMSGELKDPSKISTDLMVFWLNPETSGHPGQEQS